MSRFNQVVSVACTGAIAGGCLVVSVVLVPTWRANGVLWEVQV